MTDPPCSQCNRSDIEVCWSVQLKRHLCIPCYEDLVTA